MRFEQAFYTRGKNLLNEEEGLGIAAASKMEPQFFGICMNIGGSFNRERSHEPAEFVIYSEKLGTFMGIGLNPVNNEEGGVVNKLCHIYLPTEVHHKPDSYYLTYPFKAEVEKGSKLEEAELYPCLKETDFEKLLNKYGFDREILAGFLFKLYEILFGEKDFLLIVLDDVRYRKEDCFTIAREITWLASYLVPALKEEAFQYRKRLSYGANTKNNLSIVNLAFNTDESLNENCFYLGELLGKEIPEFYYKFAEKALSSYQDFADFLMQLYEDKFKGELDIRSIQLYYIRWKLKQEIKTEWEEISSYLSFIKRKIKTDETYRKFLYDCLIAADDVLISDLVSIWEEIIQPSFIETEMEAEEEIVAVSVRMLDLIYGKNQILYKQFLQEIPCVVQRQVMEKLYAAEDSCMWQHIKAAGTIQERKELLKLYEGLCENTDFAEYIKEDFAKVYFQMNKEEREEVSLWFKNQQNTYWEECIKHKIFLEIFKEDSYGERVEEEIGKIENCYIQLYFTYFLNKFEQEQDENRIEKIWEVAGKYLKAYDRELEDAQKKRFAKWQNDWEQRKFTQYLEGAELADVAAMDLKRYSVSLKENWCREVLERLNVESLTITILEILAAKTMDLKGIAADLLGTYQTEIWKMCQGDLEKSVCCSSVFDIEKFSIWTKIRFDEKQYEKLYELLESDDRYRRIEEQALEKKEEEFNRLSYLVWKQAIKAECKSVDIGTGFYQFQYRARICLNTLTNNLLNRAGENDGIIYIKLEQEKQKLGDCPKNNVQKYYEYKRMLEKNPDFYCVLIKSEVREEDDKIIQYIEGAKTYYDLCHKKRMEIEEYAELLYRGNKHLGLVEPVRKLEGEYRKAMTVVNSKIEKLEREISNKKNEMKHKEKEIKNLEEEIKNLEKEKIKLTEKKDNASYMEKYGKKMSSKSEVPKNRGVESPSQIRPPKEENRLKEENKDMKHDISRDMPASKESQRAVSGWGEGQQYSIDGLSTMKDWSPKEARREEKTCNLMEQDKAEYKSL